MPNRIKKIRRARGLTQQEVAERAGTTFQQIARLENSQRRLAEKWLRAVAKALEVAPADLLTGDDEAGADTKQGKFVDDPDELALLDLWKRLTNEARVRLILAFAGEAAVAAEIRRRDDLAHQGDTNSTKSEQ